MMACVRNCCMAYWICW